MSSIDLIIVLIMIVADVITGLVSAWLRHDFQSAKMREGAGHKLGELFAVGLCYALQAGLPLIGINLTINIVRGFTVYIVLMEFASVSENIIDMDPELQGPLGKLSETLKGVLNRDE